MSSFAMNLPDPPVLDIPVTPAADVWLAMSPQAQRAFLITVYDGIEQERLLSPEGRPHSSARMAATGTLGDYFERTGRRIYLASDMTVLYPGEPGFAPDLLAVLEVDDPGASDDRGCWSVADEGRGLDWVLEILVHGDRNKDLVHNVARFARLGIPEYFVYDRLRQRLYGYRLSGATSRRYESLVAKGGFFRSDVLDLELAVLDGQLRFFHGGAQLPQSRELVARLELLMSEREQVIAEREAQIEEQRQRADAEAAARARAETRADAEAAARAEEAAARRAAEAELAELRARLGLDRG